MCSQHISPEAPSLELLLISYSDIQAIFASSGMAQSCTPQRGNTKCLGLTFFLNIFLSEGSGGSETGVGLDNQVFPISVCLRIGGG